ncbi:MAG: ATP-binding protein, partial [Chloroflexi bacterium]|nr:ATP-binding protein [Chloroflexota bacterium]
MTNQLAQTNLSIDEKAASDWYTANQRYLAAALQGVRMRLEQYAPQSEPKLPEGNQQPSLASIAATMTLPPALETLCVNFGLSAFERDLLLCCAGLELDSAFAPLYAAIQGDPQRPYPTFSLALAILPEAHWSALTPGAPLRRWRLLDLGAGNTLTTSPLRIDERVLHYLAGIQQLDDRLAGLVDRLEPDNKLVPTHAQLAEQIAHGWAKSTSFVTLPVIQLCGPESAAKQSIAAAACAQLGLVLYSMAAQVLPSDPRELEAFMRFWEREATLSKAALLLDCDEQALTDAPRTHAIARLIEGVGGLLIITGRERRPVQRRPIISLDVTKPSASEQRQLWQQALGPAAPAFNGAVETLVAQFSLNAPTIYAAVATVAEQLNNGQGDWPEHSQAVAALDSPHGAPFYRPLWEACRVQARPRLDDLAQRITSQTTWADLVLPETQRQTLREVAVHVRQRATVYEQWGFAAKSGRGLGISALFAGSSGTGKTLAAEVLANELHLDLYRIDLSQVVSKYIGETEKNLRRVFDAAEEGGAVLLFDEADALFGKRSEVKYIHDRYANIEVSYLLQRMEAYRGLAILTTNMKNALDPAFLRRIRFIVNFPFPDAAKRAEIWSRIFPQATPTDGLDLARLARLNVAGGNIRNIALNGA